MAAPGRIFAINLLANSKPAENAFKNVGKAAGRLPGPVGIATAAIAASFVAVVAVVGKVSKELLELGEEFNDSFRTIRVGTGATGSAFADLQDSFREVAQSVPNDLADIATAIAEVNTRTGATGSELETLAEQFLTVSRLLGGDVQGNVRSVTRLFGDFGVEADDQADLMNVLFRASQMSGAGFSTLADQTVMYGASLRNLGFTLPESIALLASFEKNGTNLETVMSGLRTAQAKLAESGKPLSEALADVIRDIQGAETAAEGTTMAMEIFGRRSGPDLYDAIQSGRLGVDELVAAIVNGSDTIDDAADDTDGFRESFQELKNYLKITFEPAATEVFDSLTELVKGLEPAANRVAEAFEEDGLEGAFRQLGVEMKKIYEDDIKPIFEEKFIPFLNDTVKPALITFGTEAGLAIGAALWEATKKGLKNALLGDPTDKSLTELLVDQLLGRGEFDPKSEGGRLLAGDMPTPQPLPTIPEDLFLVPINPRAGGPPVPTPTPIPSPPRVGPLRRTTPDVRNPADIRNALRGARFFADGGIVTSPTLGIVGEAGPEAVIPLDRAGGMGAPTYITINVQGGDPQAVVAALRRYTRSNGPLGQVVNI